MQKYTKKSRWSSRGFYAALGICLIAAASASWIIFDSVTKTMTANQSGSVSEYRMAGPAGETVSGVYESSRQTESAGESSAAEKPTETEETAEQFSPPLMNGISRSFSGDTLAYSETLKDWRTHSGTDFTAEKDEPVSAMADGTVRSVKNDALLGTVVVIKHGDIEASYCGLSESVSVEKGNKVEAGEVIGTVGGIPAEQSEGAHLHLEVKRDGKLFDAESLF